MAYRQNGEIEPTSAIKGTDKSAIVVATIASQLPFGSDQIPRWTGYSGTNHVCCDAASGTSAKRTVQQENQIEISVLHRRAVLTLMQPAG